MTLRDKVSNEVLAVLYRYSQESDITLSDACLACADAVARLKETANVSMANNIVNLYGVPDDLPKMAMELEHRMIAEGIVSIMGITLLKGGNT